MIFWIIGSFLIWVFAFFGFLSFKFPLVEDAISYYEHIKFFIDNLARGIFPLWDPFWFNGASNDFFLRRIGSFNPFYSIVLLLQSLGLPFKFAYLCFLAGYYWSGMIAFYLLAVRLYENRLIAYAGYLVLLFSALGTRLFDSYMMLVTVPLIWFFYCLVAFSQTPRKHFFIGMCMYFMILVGTYISFYFLIFLALFVLLFPLFYYRQLPAIANSYTAFFRNNKILVIASLLLVLLSFAPLGVFFYNSSHGQIALTGRHWNPSLGNALVVPHKTLDWGAIEDLLYSAYFSDLTAYKFAIVYVPFFACIVFLLGLLGRITRRAAFMFIYGFVLLCCIIPHGLPFYNFFYKHVFFLKYFRNLHFFLWFGLIPLFVLLVLEHWKMFEGIVKGRLGIVLGVHLLVFIFFLLRVDTVLSSYVMLGLSVLFWSLLVLGRLRNNRWAFALLTATVIVQPLEVYHHLSVRTKPINIGYGYQFANTRLELESKLLPIQKISPEKGILYYAANNYNALYQNISSNYALAKYLQHKFILVDSLQPMNPQKVDFALLEKHFLVRNNKAFIFNWSSGLKTRSNDPNPPLKEQRVSVEDNNFRILSFNPNQVKLALQLPYEKFLIYNDNYDPYWQVHINGKPSKIYQVNGSFKGVWLQAGKNIIDFHYGFWWQYVMNISLLIGAFVLLAGILWFGAIKRSSDSC